jgi:hypothetical protein
LFINFKKAYESIERNKLYLAMKNLKIPKKLIGLTRYAEQNLSRRKTIGKFIINHRKQQEIAYADDVALITRSKKEIEKAFSKLEKAARGYGG